MKNLLALFCAFSLSISLASSRAADSAASAAWRAADDARVAAMTSADPTKLEATLSDELVYTHSSGKIDTKASLVAAITAGKLAYHSIEFEKREFREAVPGLLLVHGRCRIKLGKDAPHNELHAAFLASYRLEKGAWRLIAWQSCKLPD